MKKPASFHPKLRTCPNCDGSAWFKSAIGPVACQICEGTGKGEIDLDWLVADWQRLKAKYENGAAQ